MILRIVLAGLIALSAPAETRTHLLNSPRQRGETVVRVVTPDRLEPGRRYPVLYLLPVEAELGARWGDPLAEALRDDLANKFGVIVALPTFSDLPWFADHPTDPHLRQEAYFLEDVVPLVDREYSTLASAEGRYLAGFSKSGWGAWSLLLRHPDLFARAAAWDAPLMETTPEKYGMGPIFGTQENFERYQITRLVRRRAELLQGSSRLVLTGYYEGFRRQHVAMHELLEGLAIPHVYRDGPKRAHHWESGWLGETVELLLRVR
ncbi:MAG: alpha/beta hydrolase-fold protein [Bryobacterales bacterium]